MICYFCGSDQILVPEIGIYFGICGEDYNFCQQCLASMTAEEFWKKIFALKGYTWPPKLVETKEA